MVPGIPRQQRRQQRTAAEPNKQSLYWIMMIWQGRWSIRGKKEERKKGRLEKENVEGKKGIKKKEEEGRMISKDSISEN
jgi:hypothetical protein